MLVSVSPFPIYSAADSPKVTPLGEESVCCMCVGRRKEENKGKQKDKRPERIDGKGSEKEKDKGQRR